MKCYLDEVFQYSFAYGTGGDKLKGKKFIHSYTTGSGAATYEGSEFGSALTLPLKCTAAYTQMEYVGAFPLYGQLSLTNPNIAQEAREHAEKLVSLLKTL
jgi:NAD(P)H dehydrogenase (quinone) (fragment)